MKRATWLLASVVMVGWGLTSALGACGGSNDVSTTGGDGGGTSTSSSSSSSSGGPDDAASTSSSSSSSSGGSDGGSTSSSSGGTSTPGSVACGTQTCSTTGQTCCEPADGGAHCADAGVPGACPFNAIRLRCDEPADCDGGAKCCFGAGGSQCQQNCFGGELVLCQTSAQCPDAGTCKQVTCDFTQVGGGIYKLDACNTNQACK